MTSRVDPLNPLQRDVDAAVTLTWASGLVVHQARAGIDVADPTDDNEAGMWKFARSNANLVYIIGDTASGEAVAVDAAFDIEGIHNFAKSRGFALLGSIYTHNHFDHCGGLVPASFAGREGIRVAGAAEIVAKGGTVWICEADLAQFERLCFEGHQNTSDLIQVVKDGDIIAPSKSWSAKHSITTIHTPGHTPGSICLLVGGNENEKLGKCVSSYRGVVGGANGMEFEGQALLTGDTLFQGNVGRAGGKSLVAKMFESLQKLKRLQDDVQVLPAHHYGFCTSTTIGVEKKMNTLFGKCKTVEQFQMVSGMGLGDATGWGEVDGAEAVVEEEAEASGDGQVISNARSRGRGVVYLSSKSARASEREPQRLQLESRRVQFRISGRSFSGCSCCQPLIADDQAACL